MVQASPPKEQANGAGPDHAIMIVLLYKSLSYETSSHRTFALIDATQRSAGTWSFLTAYMLIDIVHMMFNTSAHGTQ